MREVRGGLKADRFGGVDALLTNSGGPPAGATLSFDDAAWQDAAELLLFSTLRMVRGAVPLMQARGGGRIVNISSVGGKVGVPHLTPYCASKFALVGFSESVRPELARSGIYVTTVCPGLMRTGSPFNAWFKGDYRAEFAWFAISDSLPLLSINGRRAAGQIVDAMRAGDAELVITWPARLAVLANNALPELAADALALANSMLPSPADGDGHKAHSGWQSGSEWAPSKLTALTERAAAENNELPPALK